MKDTFIAAILGVIMTLNFFDVITDIGLGVPRWHIIEEGLIVVVSAIGFVYLMWEMNRRTRQLRELSRTLSEADRQLQHTTEEMRKARRVYATTIQRQFDAWELTQSEQQVAMLMLKGLSFREIAAVRETKEKTVRQQASVIYGKSGLDGRHAFAGWFLEDLLAAPWQGDPVQGDPVQGDPDQSVGSSRPPSSSPANTSTMPSP